MNVFCWTNVQIADGNTSIWIWFMRALIKTAKGFTKVVLQCILPEAVVKRFYLFHLSIQIDISSCVSFACFFHFIHFSGRVVVWHSTFAYIFLVTDSGAPFCTLAIWTSFLEMCPSFCPFVYQVYYLLGAIFFMICAYTLSILGTFIRCM